MSAPRKSERLLNLLIMLLVQRHYVPKSRIRSILYPDASDEAFDRMFDRDKDELRSLGVPIEVGRLDPLFDDEPGYRVRPEDLALPPVDLEPDEAAVVGLATRVWQHQRLAEATTEAVRKLTAAGLEVDLAALDIAEPRLAAEEPVFDVFWEGVQARRTVVFDYRRPGETTASRRRLQPWGVARHAGRWYVVGWDLDRSAERVFRLSRVVGDARLTGPARAYEVPAGTDVRAIARSLAPAPARVEVELLVRSGAGHRLRSVATSVEPVAAPPGAGPGSRWDRVRLTGSPGDLEEEALAHGPDVVVVAPASLRERVVARLRAGVAALAAEAP